MALDGLEPVVIFKLYRDYTKDMTLQEWQQLSEVERDLKYTPIPIPIYLGGLLGGEQLTGLALDDADQTIDFGQTSIGGLYFKKNMGNDVTITFRARRDNPIMIMLLAVISQLIALIPDQRYGITLYYDSIFVLNGLIKSITQQTINNSNIKLVQIVISERASSSSESGSKNPIDKVNGADTFGGKPAI
jgi:hypothetical protein